MFCLLPLFLFFSPSTAFIGYVDDMDAATHTYQMNITRIYWGDVPANITIIPSLDNGCACPILDPTEDLLIILTEAAVQDGQILRLSNTDFVAMATEYPIELLNGNVNCMFKIQ